MTNIRRLLDATLARLAEIGADPGDDEETRFKKALLVLIAILIFGARSQSRGRAMWRPGTSAPNGTS